MFLFWGILTSPRAREGEGADVGRQEEETDSNNLGLAESPERSRTCLGSSKRPSSHLPTLWGDGAWS